MPNAIEVNPTRWSEIIVLFDNDDYSAIWGKYDNYPSRTLGVRWNKNFPSQGKNPLWYIEPRFFIPSILHAILDMLKTNATNVNYDEYTGNTFIALQEFYLA